VTLSQTLLWPFTLPYGAIVNLRARAYRTGLLRQKHLDGIVISVGNLTTGGTGKTPMVLWITERLVAEGKRVGILTRGYRGISGTQTQSAEIAASSAAGTGEASSSDEVQLLLNRLGDRVAFGVGADRFARGTELAKNGVEWFVLDDGFQHLQLARDVNIVLVDATNPFGGGYLLPAGRLREPRTALGRADIIVITRSDYTPALEAKIRLYTAAPIFHACARLDSILSVNADGSVGPQTNLKNEKLFAFSGIGNGPAFVNDLRNWGYSIVGSKYFPDHHRYSQRDANAIEAEARGTGATALICTEKDKYNLAGVRWQANKVWYCRISFQVNRDDEFWATIKTKATSRPAAAR
jgi:tetraacyldisaccharide 4'-kinase